MPRPSIPAAGLHEVLRSWSGTGELLHALAAVEPDDLAERRWSAADVYARAARILALELVSPMSRWPASARLWQQALPAESMRSRFWADEPQAKVDWRRTLRRGWPPDQYAIRRRRRAPETSLVTALRWTIERVEEIFTMAARLHPRITAPVDAQTATAFSLLRSPPLVDAVAERPDRAQVSAMRGAGSPWRAVAAVAGHIDAVDRMGVEQYAERYLIPSEDMRSRLFQLGVLGEMLLGATDAGGQVTSVRPIGDGVGGAVYEIVDSFGRRWEVWFEAAGIWSACDVPEAYFEMAGGLTHLDGKPVARRRLSPDLLLVARDVGVLVVECKYSDNDPSYVASGFAQATTYGAQLHDLAPTIVALVVGPREFVATSRRVDLPAVGEVGVVDPDGIRAATSELLQKA